MKKYLKIILKGAIDHHKGSISPADMINGIAKHDEKSVEYLVAHRYLEYVPVDKPGINNSGFYTLQFYRVSEKGHAVFLSWYKKLWYNLKGDIRTVFVALVTAFGTTLITIYISKLLQ